jgi:phage terminase large subunit-like protein
MEAPVSTTTPQTKAKRARTRGSLSSRARSSDPGCQRCRWRPPADGDGLWPTWGYLAIRWIEKWCICGDGDWYGQLIKLRTDQRKFLLRWYEYCPQCDQWRYDEALRGAATGDGKTQFVAAIVVLEFAGPPQIRVESPNIPIAAASFEQADRVFSAVSTMCGGQDQQVKQSPLREFFEVYDTEIKYADGASGRVFRIAAAAGTNEGGLPSLFVCDELHEWGEAGSAKARLKTVVGKSTRKRKTPHGCGRQIMLSTAGFDIDHSLLGDYVKQGRRVLRNPKLAPRFLFDWREAPDGLDYRKPSDRELAVRAASQAADVLWSVQDRVDDWGSPSMPAHEWIRYYANRWVEIPEDSWLKEHPAAWADAEGEWESDESNPCCLSVDMALAHDSVAVDRVEELPDGRFAVTARIWNAADYGGRIPHDEVWAYITDEAKGADFRGVVYDPRFFEVPARMLEHRGILAVEFDQSPQRMAPACGLALELLIASPSRIVHDGDPDLADHVKRAAKVPQERGGFTLKKGKSKGHIDACVAMVMGLRTLHDVPEEPPPKPFALWGKPMGGDA